MNSSITSPGRCAGPGQAANLFFWKTDENVSACVGGGIDRDQGIPRKKLNFCHSSKFRQLKNVYTFSKLKHMQWRIQDFPGMDANLLFGIIFGENRIKMKKKIGRGGGASLAAPRFATDPPHKLP